MTANQFRAMTAQQKSDYRMFCAVRENAGALMELSAFEDYLDKTVEVVNGRKVPIGTTGVVFWIGMRNYSQYGNWWSWEVRLGLKTENGETFFTAERYPLINIKAAIVDGKEIKADTWYTLIGGKFVECD